MTGSPLDGAPWWLKAVVLPFVLVSDAKYAVKRKLRRKRDGKEAVQAGKDSKEVTNANNDNTK